jgi:hypothetical protein
VQLRLDHPPAKPADGGFIRHRFVGAQAHEPLKTQPIPKLLLSLWIAQIVEMLEQHDA